MNKKKKKRKYTYEISGTAKRIVPGMFDAVPIKTDRNGNRTVTSGGEHAVASLGAQGGGGVKD